MKSFAFLILSLTFVSCNMFHSGSESQLEEQVDSFAIYYFNWQFYNSVRFVTPESKKWMSYAASQVHEADIELLRQKEKIATYTLNDIDYHENDTTADARITVHNFLQMDTIGKACQLIEKAEFAIPLVYREQEDKWIVNLNGLPRPLRK